MHTGGVTICLCMLSHLLQPQRATLPCYARDIPFLVDSCNTTDSLRKASTCCIYDTSYVVYLLYRIYTRCRISWVYYHSFRLWTVAYCRICVLSYRKHTILKAFAVKFCSKMDKKNNTWHFGWPPAPIPRAPCHLVTLLQHPPPLECHILFESQISIPCLNGTIRYYTKLYDFALQQSHTIGWGIGYTTDFIQHVVGLNYASYDTTRLYASVVLQVSTFWLKLAPFSLPILRKADPQLGDHTDKWWPLPEASCRLSAIISRIYF